MSRFLENYSKLFSKVFTNIRSVIYNKKIKFYVYYDAEIYHTKIDYGSRNEINDYNISSVSKNKKIDNKIYKDMEKFTEYEITKDDWTFQNVYDMLRQD